MNRLQKTEVVTPLMATILGMAKDDMDRDEALSDRANRMSKHVKLAIQDLPINVAIAILQTWTWRLAKALLDNHPNMLDRLRLITTIQEIHGQIIANLMKGEGGEAGEGVADPASDVHRPTP